MKSNFLFLTAIAASMLCACSGEESASSVTKTNNLKKGVQAEIDALQKEALESRKQYYSLIPSKGITNVTTKSGVVISINPSTFTVNGRHFNGAIKVEFIEIYKRSQMATANKTTLGVADPENQTDEVEGIDLWPLVSGGEFYVNMTTENGQQIDNGAEYSLTIPTGATGGTDPGMLAWNGTEDADGNVTWEKKTDTNGDPIPVTMGEQGGYQLNLDNFGWANCDRFYSVPGPKTTILVDVPAGYDNTNSVVYLATAGEQNLLAPLDHYDAGTELFSEHYGHVPVGLSGYIIYVAGTTAGWEYEIIPVTFTPGLIVSVDPALVLTGTQADVENAIDALP
ncbi:MAG: hypothetical protein V4581_06910 [Bacteroidota bacterium]